MFNYYEEIKEKLIDNEIKRGVKIFSINQGIVETYYYVGKILYEAGKHYGENIIGEYSKKLENDIGKKYSITLLKRMRKFYIVFQKSAPSGHLSWSHYRVLITIKNEKERNYYINEIKKRNLTKREFEEIYKHKEYNRLSLKTKNKIAINQNREISELIKDPIFIYNNSNIQIYSEKVLQNIILNNISIFLNELGEGYSFIDNEYKIKIGNTYNYIDLLLFNYKYNCFVVIELKIVELKKEHIGQIEIYMNYIDKNIKEVNHNKTIGIIICKKDNKFIIEYASDKRVITREYKLIV